MKSSPLEVLSPIELERVHQASITILEEVGLHVPYHTARDYFQGKGAFVDHEARVVKIPLSLVEWALEQAPASFTLYGNDPQFKLQIGGDQEFPVFAGLGTPLSVVDLHSGEIRAATRQDMLEHIILINACRNIHGCQMDVWPDDIPMTTIHTEAIRAWAENSRKTFGMGCYGYLPTWDMMRMTALAVGGKEELRRKPRFMAICSVVSPLQMDQSQLEGMFICADYGQPVALSPEGIAGATAPVTLAGLLAQENAAILAHITLAQIFRPGTPVLYGTVSTVANMRDGTVALGAPETGLITAASAQLARLYKLPIRSVGGATDAKRANFQAGFERMGNLLPAVLAGVNLITCAGTLDGTLLEDHAMLMFDDEMCAAALRVARGIEVTDETLPLDLIREVGYTGNYLAAEHTAQHFKDELFIPSLSIRQPYQSWEENGSPSALDRAREKALQVLNDHQPLLLDPTAARAMDDFQAEVAARDLNDFYAHEQPENQDFETL